MKLRGNRSTTALSRLAYFFLAAAVLSLASLAAREFSISDVDREHWAFQPIQRVDPPVLPSDGWTQTPIDQFIFAKLNAAGLNPASASSREQLIRRVSFDLIGLPPTPAEIHKFLDDTSPDAYERLVDRLLASPHYGERWGRHWLDLARFAQSDGFEHDAVRPNAWRYRDYVVRSLNAGKPYDQFIKEQIAGDELYPDDHDASIATAFNLLGPDMVDSADQVQRRHNTLNDMTDTAGLVFLGLTVGCARCHDHKFEPFSQRDYYRLQAFFTPAKFRNDFPIATPEQQAEFQQALGKFTAATNSLHRRIMAADAGTSKALKEELKRMAKPALPVTMALENDTNQIAKTFVLVRGEITRPGDQITPGFPEVLARPELPEPSLTPHKPRSALARWLADPKNPLTARVMVNRIWQHHFGRGIVPTSSDFGRNGQPPTHPELLDWLASEFIAGHWSIKRVHKLILLSAAYQQSSTVSLEARQLDPDNKLFSRQNRKRFEGEIIRDSLLAISGQMNSTFGGPGVFPPVPAELFQGAKGWTPNKNPNEYRRRSIYIFVRRNLRFPFLEVFDAPDNNLSCSERARSISAPQSLALLNAEEVVAAANATAKQILTEAGTVEAQIKAAYWRIVGRAPSPEELARSRTFLDQSPVSELCRALFNLNAFVYVD